MRPHLTLSGRVGSHTVAKLANINSVIAAARFAIENYESVCTRYPLI